MRFILKIKQDGKQVGIKRVESKNQLHSTNDILALIQKSISIQKQNFIVRVLSDQYKFRIIQGWPLSLYGIKSGLQLQVEIVKINKQQIIIIQNKDEKIEKVGEVLFNKKEMDKIVEMKQQDQAQQVQQNSQISQLVQKKYQQLLRIIQNKDAKEYFRQIKQGNTQLGSCQNEVYKKQLLTIQNQLGAHGWGAIHYAVFVGSAQICNFLIQIGVDINAKTTDQWLPIQIAIKQCKYQMIDLLIAQPLLNINICTAQGLPLNLAVQSSNKALIQKILLKDVNFLARDHKNRTVYDVLGMNPDKNILQLLQREQKRQSISSFYVQKKVMYHALIFVYKGLVTYVKMLPRKDKQYYLCLNPYESCVKIYSQKSHFPQFPKQVIPFLSINRFNCLQKNQKSWYMKNDLFYFVVSTQKSKYIFGCNFENTRSKWISAFQQCLEHVKMYPDSIKNFKRNQDCSIMDVVQNQAVNKRKIPTNDKQSLMQLFMSRSSEKSQQSPTKHFNSQKLQDNVKSPEKSQNKKNNQNNSSKNEKTSQAKSTDTSAKQNSKDDSTTMNTNNNLNIVDHQRNKIYPKFADFKIIKILGQGAFGTVLLASDLRNPQNKKMYALKCFKKKKLVVNKQIKYTIAQLNILKQLSHPYIVNLHFTFQTPNYVYLGLDYCSNKDLSHHLMNQVTFPQKDAMMYAAEILSALQYLHSKNIIYRDLKPENVMLDSQGHVRLVDFGLSKQGQDRQFVAKSFCGSPAYLSPEMLVKKGVGKQSDFYCLGALLYQMLVGQPPFFSDDIVTLYNNISNSKLTFPKMMSNDAKNLLSGLLQRTPQNRLGYKGANQIKNHPFFKQINWDNLTKKLISAPIREQVQVNQQQQQDNFLINDLHKDFDYTAQNHRINRFLNFTFVRESQSQKQTV